MKIIHNPDTCKALGVCESMGPDRFEINADGVLEVLDHEAPESARQAREHRAGVSDEVPATD